MTPFDGCLGTIICDSVYGNHAGICICNQLHVAGVQSYRQQVLMMFTLQGSQSFVRGRSPHTIIIIIDATAS